MRKENLPILVGIILPVILVIIVAILVYLPKSSINPEHDFIYSQGDRYSYKNDVVLIDGEIVLSPNADQYYRNNPDSRLDHPELFIYDVDTDSIKKVSLAEANSLDIYPGPTSEDGYIVNYQGGHNGIFELFGSDNSNTGYFISKGNAKKKLDSISGSGYYGYNFNFIGWIR